MIRAVLDANVVASMFPAQKGLLVTLRDFMFRGAFEGVISSQIFDEVEATWLKPYWRRRLPTAQRVALLMLVLEELTIVEVNRVIPGVAPHLQDDHVLAAAVEADTDLIVTGDQELAELFQYGNALIYRPAQLVHVLSFTERIGDDSGPM